MTAPAGGLAPSLLLKLILPPPEAPLLLQLRCNPLILPAFLSLKYPATSLFKALFPPRVFVQKSVRRGESGGSGEPTNMVKSARKVQDILEQRRQELAEGSILSSIFFERSLNSFSNKTTAVIV